MKRSILLCTLSGIFLGLFVLNACSSPTPAAPTPTQLAALPSPSLPPTETPLPTPTFAPERVASEVYKLPYASIMKSVWTVSADLRRLAIGAPEGTGQAMLVDGIKLGSYDSVSNPEFSPDNRRFAFFAVKNGKQMAVIDGKEDAPYDRAYNQSALRFSPDSAHVAYIATKGSKQVVVMDGKESSAYDEIAALSFSPTNRFIAFWARTGKQWSVVVDGKEGKPYDEIDYVYQYSGRTIALSKDGEHVAYRAIQGGKDLLVIDGREGKLYDDIGDVTQNPAEWSIAYTAKSGDTWRMVLNDQEQTSYQAVGRPVFSPDGKRLIYRAQSGGKWLLMTEEGASKSHDEMLDPLYSPDGQHVALAVKTGDKFALSVDGQEQKAYDEILANSVVYSRDGQRLAYAAREGIKVKMVVDGQEGPSYDEVGVPVFSPDGQHLAYPMQSGSKKFVVIDGQESGPYDDIGRAVFEPDGTVVYYIARGDGLYLAESRLVTSAPARADAQQTATAVAQANTAVAARDRTTATAQALVRATANALATSTRAVQATATAVAKANATATAQAIPVVTNPAALDWPIVLSDPFDQIGNDWTAGSFTFDSGKVIKSIASGKYTWDVKATNSLVDRDLPTMISLGDMEVSVDARQVSGAAGSPYGLAFRDDLHNYFLFLVADDQSYQFGYGTSSSLPKVIQKGKSNVIRAGGVNRLAVIARGSHFSFYVNNQIVFQADDARLAKGSAGPAVELLNAGDKAVFEFDNFEVRVPTPGPTLAAVRKWPAVISEPFDQKVNGWPLDDSDSVGGPATAVIEKGVYRWTTSCTESWIKWELPDKIGPQGDMYVSVVARKVSGPSAAGYGLVLRENDTHDSLYGLEIRDDGKVRVVAVIKGEVTSLVSWTSSGAVRPGQANRLAAIASGSHLAFFVNDLFVGQVDDDRLKSGHAGILFELHSGESGVFEYDNFELRAP